jgi:hypothetical protein
MIANANNTQHKEPEMRHDLKSTTIRTNLRPTPEDPISRIWRVDNATTGETFFKRSVWTFDDRGIYAGLNYTETIPARALIVADDLGQGPALYTDRTGLGLDFVDAFPTVLEAVSHCLNLGIAIDAIEHKAEPFDEDVTWLPIEAQGAFFADDDGALLVAPMNSNGTPDLEAAGDCVVFETQAALDQVNARLGSSFTLASLPGR